MNREERAEKLTKQPKWVQDWVRVLQADLKEAERDLDAALGDGESGCWVDDAAREFEGGGRSYIRNESVVFAVGKDEFTVRGTREGMLQIAASMTTLRVVPVASNMVEVGSEKR